MKIEGKVILEVEFDIDTYGYDKSDIVADCKQIVREKLKGYDKLGISFSEAFEGTDDLTEKDEDDLREDFLMSTDDRI